MATYSFLNINVAFSGPGVNASLGAGAGDSEEGITIEMIEDKTDMKVGADGTIMHSLRASNAARISIRLLKTAPANAILSAAYNFQKASSLNFGKNQLRITDVARGDVITATDLGFAKLPVITYAKDAGMNEWQFLGQVPAELLGTGVPDVNL